MFESAQVTTYIMQARSSEYMTCPSCRVSVDSRYRLKHLSEHILRQRRGVPTELVVEGGQNVGSYLV
jgi:hypothetical protein